VTSPDPVVPDYGGACIAGIVPALFAPGRPAQWLPAPVRDANQVVLVVLDGLGWLQLRDRLHLAPALAAMVGGPISSVAPSTTSAALTSITTGVAPGVHGVVGYRVHVGGGDVLNVLRWQTSGADAIDRVPPGQFQTSDAFGGLAVPVVTKSEFERGGFTRALIGGARFVGYWTPSSIAVETRRLLADGAPLVYAYYDGVDKIAHTRGFGAHYDAELAAADRLIADIADTLPPGAALLVTADHGQVEVGDRLITLDDDVLRHVAFQSGEGRMRWLHARDGEVDLVAKAARRYDDEELAWVRTRDEAIAEGWFGDVRPDAAARLGDVVLAARAPVSFIDPAEHGHPLICRHGSLTEDEMLVPLLAARRMA
jgi:predicted AlkP superfamily pyrophosphatase or phosphodiesterase